MTIVRAVCVMCGDVTIKPWEITLVVEYPGANEGEYVFEHCGVPTVRYAGPRTITVLLSVGVDIEDKQSIHPSVKRSIQEVRNRYIMDEFADWLATVETVADMERTL